MDRLMIGIILALLFLNGFGQCGALAASVAIPTVEGERYEAHVPDTLDLAERAELAIKALTLGADPELDYEPRGSGTGTFFLTTKWLEALPMMRQMSGSEFGLETERKMMESFLSHIGEDGLLYCPANTPARQGGRGYAKTTEDYTSPYADGRMILAMIAWQQRDGDPAWTPRIKKMADALERIAIKKDDYAYYPDPGVAFDFSYLKQSGYAKTDEPAGEHAGAEGTVKFYQSNQVRALARWAALGGDREALSVAGKVARFIRQPKFWEKGSPREVVGYQRGQWSGHYHGNSATLMGLLRYAVVANDVRLKDFVRASYEYSRNFGVPRLGWFPSYAGHDTPPTFVCETCRTSDMIYLAVEMSTEGIGDYWDDVDGYVRNTMVEQQYVNHAMVKAAMSEEAAQYGLGAFGCGGLTSMETYLPACCTGNGAQGLYYAWEAIVRGWGGGAQVNLLLNRASPWLDVDSYLPYEGKVVLRNKKARTVSVRIPGWVDKKAVVCRVDGEKVASTWMGGYLTLNEVGMKDEIVITFPLVEETFTQRVAWPSKEKGSGWTGEATWYEPLDYKLHFKGNTLIDISPRDETVPYPIYQREKYKSDQAPMKQVMRYVAPYTIQWYSDGR